MRIFQPCNKHHFRGRVQMSPRRHTTLNLDMELIEEARQVLGTVRATETIHLALQEVIDHDKRRRLLDMGTGDLTPERLHELRRNRSFDPADPPQPA
jgi:Arc/MetJ family transcription regulator